MSDEEKPKFAIGDKVAIVGGRKNVGVRGEVFWTGENKYGPGVRYGVRDEDGEAYWIDEAKLGKPEDAPPPPEKKKREAKPPLAKGARVEIIGGREGKGETGEVFWVGDSKFGVGLRYGVRCGEDETYWVDEMHVEALDTPSDEITAPPADGPSNSPSNSLSNSPSNAQAKKPSNGDTAPMPDPDEFADYGNEVQPNDDAPFPEDEDIPF